MKSKKEEVYWRACKWIRECELDIRLQKHLEGKQLHWANFLSIKRKALQSPRENPQNIRKHIQGVQKFSSQYSRLK